MLQKGVRTIDKLTKMRANRPIAYEVKAENDVLYLYGDVGGWKWRDEESIHLDDVKDTIKEMDSNEVTIHLNSYGGDAMEGVAIYNLLKNKFENIRIIIDGIAASAASVIAMVGDSVEMGTGAQFMIHQPSTYAYGNAQDFEETLQSLKSIEEGYMDIYMTRFNGSREELEDLMAQSTWFGTTEAQEWGFSNGVTDEAVEVEEEEAVAVDEEKLAILVNKAVASALASAKREEEPTVEENTEEDSGRERLLLFAKNLTTLGGLEDEV